jgi:flavodoxin
MKTLFIYDSVFGNTGKIADAVYQAFSPDAAINYCHVNEFRTSDLESRDLLIVGSPTRGFSPTPAISEFIRSIPSNGLTGISIATFDTRLDLDSVKSSAIRFLVKTGGYAANKMAERLAKKGGRLITGPQGFYVTGEEGPLKQFEIERAARWSSNLIRLAMHCHA